MSYEVRFKRTEPMHTASITRKTIMKEIGNHFMDILPKVAAHVQTSGGTMAGPPFGRYLSFTNTEVILQAGVPVAAPVAGANDIEAGEIPAEDAVAIDFYGDYNKLPEGWSFLHSWIKENGYEYADAPYELYWTDPMEEPDSSKWRTEIVVPVKKKS
jgi:effector-binding domain-containing protein